MKNTLIITLVLLSTTMVFAKKNCTNQPKEKWMSEAAFKELAKKQGYTIRKFKQPGSCYEIYGKDKAGKNVEVYFNPVDGSTKKVKFENENDDDDD